MANLTIDPSKALQAMTDATTVMDGAVAFVNGFRDLVKTEVTAALTADNSADQDSINAAMSAIDGAADQMEAKKAELAAALLANTTPAEPQPNEIP